MFFVVVPQIIPFGFMARCAKWAAQRETHFLLGNTRVPLDQDPSEDVRDEIKTNIHIQEQ